MNNFKSSTKNIDIGVVQGSCCGPTFFNVFINDICNITNFKCTLFADDAGFYLHCNDFNEMNINVNSLLNNLSLYLNMNRLLPNISKTKLMVFSLKNFNISHLPAIYFNENVLEWTNSFKYLGVFLDSKLTFNIHTKHVRRLLNSVKYKA